MKKLVMLVAGMAMLLVGCGGGSKGGGTGTENNIAMDYVVSKINYYDATGKLTNVVYNDYKVSNIYEDGNSASGDVIATSGELYKVRYTKADGTLIKYEECDGVPCSWLKKYDATGKQTDYQHFEYMSFSGYPKYILVRAEYYTISADGTKVLDYTIKTDFHSTITQTRIFDTEQVYTETGKKAYKDVNEYDAKTLRRLNRKTYFYEGVSTYWSEYSYDENNRLIEEKEYSKSYLSRIIRSDYDKAGNIIKKRYYDSDGKTYQGELVYEYKYLPKAE